MSFFGLFGSSKAEPSGKTAKDRLAIVLTKDRASRISDDVIENLKSDILEVIKKYIDIDENFEVGIKTNSENPSQSLIADIPIKNWKSIR